VQPGDLLAIMTTGAYGAVQASTYNTRPLIPEVLVKGVEAAVVRARIDAVRQIGFDSLPGWLKA
jgi:diaminopimelate decarboxylase